MAANRPSSQTEFHEVGNIELIFISESGIVKKKFLDMSTSMLWGTPLKIFKQSRLFMDFIQTFGCAERFLP